MPPRLLWRLFPHAARASRWLEQRFTAGGRLLLGVLVSGAILGIDIRQTLAYQLAALAFALLVSSLALSTRWRAQLTVRRVLPPMVTADLATHYWLEITNHGRDTQSELLVQDMLDDPPLSRVRFKSWRDSHRAVAHNWFDRAVGFPLWLAVRRWQHGAVLALTPIAPIAPGATVRVKIELTALRRGWLRFVGLRVLRPEPLGLCRARLNLVLVEQLLALPRRHRVPTITLQSARRYQPGGVSLALAVGDAQEFAALRDYQPGDPRRHIHWRSVAKTGALIVKQYQDEYFARHALVVDTRLADTPACCEAVIEVAASIASGRQPQDAILDLIIVGTDVVELAAGRGLGSDLRALTYLATTPAHAHHDFAPVAALLRARLGHLASVIMVCGRDDPARNALLAELRNHQVPTLCLQVVDEQQSAPPTHGEHAPTRLRIDHLAADLACVGGAP